MTKTERRCPKCAKPIDLHLAFCREDWFKLPVSLRDAITSTIKAKNFLAKSRAIQAALEWFTENQEKHA